MAKTETIKFKADTSSVTRGIKTMTASAKALAVSLASVAAVAAPMLAIAGAAKTLGIAFEAVNKAASFETLQLQLANVLKSSTEASVVFDKIKSFSASTPFQVSDITKGVTALSIANKELGTNKELWLEVGNTAAKGGRTFSEVAKQVGKYMAATESATGSIATPLESLAGDMGIISPQQKDDLLGLKKAGVDAATLQQALRKVMAENDGNMKRQSASWEGLKSTLADVKDLMMDAFGKGIIKNLKPTIVDLTNKLKEWEPILKKWGEKAAEIQENLYNAFTSTNGNGMELLTLGLKIAAKSFTNVMYEGLMLVADKFGKRITNPKRIFGNLLDIADTTSGLSGGLSKHATNMVRNQFGIDRDDNTGKGLYNLDSDLSKWVGLLDKNKTDKFQDTKDGLEEDMNIEPKEEPKSTAQKFADAIVKKLAGIDFKKIGEVISSGVDKVLEITNNAAKEFEQAKVDNFTGNSSQLRPVSNLTAHGGGGVYGTTGTQQHNQQMLSSTKSMEKHLEHISRNIGAQNGGVATYGY